MTNFLKRFFLCFFPIVACLFLLNLLIPVAAYAHTTGLFTAQLEQSSDASFHSVASVGFYASLMQAATPVPTPVPITPTPTPVPTTVPITPTPTPVPTPVPITPTPTPVPTMAPATSTPTAVPSPTPIPVPTPIPTPTPTTGGNTNTNSVHAALNTLIFTMGGTGMLLVIVGVILYFVYSRSI